MPKWNKIARKCTPVVDQKHNHFSEHVRKRLSNEINSTISNVKMSYRILTNSVAFRVDKSIAQELIEYSSISKECVPRSLLAIDQFHHSLVYHAVQRLHVHRFCRSCNFSVCHRITTKFSRSTSVVKSQFCFLFVLLHFHTNAIPTRMPTTEMQKPIAMHDDSNRLGHVTE